MWLRTPHQVTAGRHRAILGDGRWSTSIGTAIVGTATAEGGDANALYSAAGVQPLGWCCVQQLMASFVTSGTDAPARDIRPRAPARPASRSTLA
jgi:hypothetical protein